MLRYRLKIPHMVGGEYPRAGSIRNNLVIQNIFHKKLNRLVRQRLAGK